MHGIGQLGRAAHGEDKGLEVVALYVDILQVPVLGEIDRVQFAFAQPKLLQIGELSKVFVGADLEHIGAVLREDQQLERIGLFFRYVSVVVCIALEECPPLHALVCKGCDCATALDVMKKQANIMSSAANSIHLF